MITIDSIYQNTKNYHSTLDPETRTICVYLGEENGYMCGIGCQAENPGRVERMAREIHMYTLTALFEDPEGKAVIESDSFLRELSQCDEKVIDFAFQVQCKHDGAITVGGYLKNLEELYQTYTEE